MSFDKILKPQYDYDLIRIGRDNDGGYLVEKKSLENSQSLISLGINDDWSFEEDFLKKNKDISIKCFDDVLDKKFLLKRIIVQFLFLLYNRNFSILKKYISTYFSFLRLKKKIQFNKKKVSYNHLNKILSQEKNNIFLKIDIEGGEYRILEDLLLNQKKIIGLVIEFHDHDLHREKILKFLNSFNLTLVHIHGNNFAGRDLNNDITTLELTFSKNPVQIGDINILPNKLDMPNNFKKSEIILNFKK
tara:strand:- start:1036 stop:1773 length:738 start_codon:yes stop_codon:yes gene_type:complete